MDLFDVLIAVVVLGAISFFYIRSIRKRHFSDPTLLCLEYTKKKKIFAWSFTLLFTCGAVYEVFIHKDMGGFIFSSVVAISMADWLFFQPRLIDYGIVSDSTCYCWDRFVSYEINEDHIAFELPKPLLPLKSNLRFTFNPTQRDELIRIVETHVPANRSINP